MKFLMLVLATVILGGCVENSGPAPLKFQASFSMGDKDYLIYVSTYPEEPTAGQPFTLRIALKDAKTLRAVTHLTYEVQIQDKDGKNVFLDSRHATEGAPYANEITLGAGDYILKPVVDHGMGAEIMKLYETALELSIK